MNPLAIRIAADLKAFKANMDEMRTQLETNASAMKRMSSAFDGSRAIGDANAMVKAIADIGGASKLTEAEQKRVNAAVTEAIAKYEALGRQVPPELLALRDATKQVVVEVEKQKDSTKRLFDEIQKQPTAMDKVGTRAVAMGAAIGTALGGIAWQAVNKLGAEVGVFVKRGAELPALQASFTRLSSGVKQDADAMLSSMQKASRGLVSEYDLMKAGNKAMLLGLPVTTESMGTLAKAATTLGRAMGQDATKSVDDLITALGRSSPMILDNLGLTVKVGEANEIYARQLGKTVEKLTDAEKKTAFYNEAMRKAAIKTKELGEQTLTLGDYLGILWTNVGNKVSSGVSTVNVAAGELIGGLGKAKEVATGFWESLSMGAKGAAFNLAGFGRTQEQVSTIMTNAIPPKKEAAKVTRELTEEEKALAKAFQEQVDILTGKGLAREVAALTREVAAAEKQGGLTAFQYKELGKRLDDMREKGALLPNVLHKIWLDHERLNPSIKTTVGAYTELAGILKNFQSFELKPMPKIKELMFSEQMSKAEWTAILNLGAVGPLAKVPAAEFGFTFLGSLAKALEGLGSVIVGAIQGGGDVGRAAFAHIGLGLGNDLGAAIAKGIGGQMGKILGGLAGPLGSLLGGAVGGLLDKIFGKNQGREDAKSFAAAFGGFDALRQEMLKLGAEGDRLWIQLTQNTKGPAQVAATIRQIEEAFRKAEEAATKSGAAMEDAFKGPEGARGFPTKAQLQKAARDAEEAYRYMAASGEYTADVIEQAWQQWQDAMIASGDETAKRMKDLAAEITSLQKAVEMETPEYDADGVRIYGVEELRNIERLAALEAEKAALVIAAIENEKHAVEEAAKAADLTADKEFEAAKLRAINLDGYLHKLFSKGYEIPITFRLPGGLPSGGGLPNNGSPFGNGAPLPTLPARASAAPTTIIVPVLLDGKEVARNQVKYIPKELDFIGARR